MKYEYIFHGRVIPERADVNFKILDWFEVSQPDTKLKFKIKFFIIRSVITATIISKSEIANIDTLKNIVFMQFRYMLILLVMAMVADI